jgi:uncharacterized membrane protein
MAASTSSFAPRPRLAPGLVLGMGLGGFLDGIALHQIAQWHNMGSAVLPPTTMAAMRQNMAWDGWFHAAMLVLTLVGAFLLLREGHRAAPLPTKRGFLGQLLLGWGVFNLAEGIVDHHLLGLHHVRDMPAHVPLYDWLFLGLGGVALIALGWWLATRGEVAVVSRPRTADALLRTTIL